MDLKFDTGDVVLNVQGDPARKLIFNPTDPKLLSGFLKLVDIATEKSKEFSARAAAIDEDKLSDDEYHAESAKLLLDIDAWFRGEFDKLFGKDMAQVVFGDTSTTAINSDGDYVMMAMLMALYPYFESEVQKRSGHIDDIIAEIKADAEIEEKPTKKAKKNVETAEEPEA